MDRKIILLMLMLTSCTKPSLERNAEQWRKIQELQDEEQMLLEKRDQQLAELEMVGQALSDSANGHYNIELKFLNAAKSIQSEIERLQANGEDTSELEEAYALAMKGAMESRALAEKAEKSSRDE